MPALVFLCWLWDCSLLAVFQSVDTVLCVISVRFWSFAVDVSGPLSCLIAIPLRLLIQTTLNSCRSSLQMGFHFLPFLQCLVTDYSLADDCLTGILCHVNFFYYLCGSLTSFSFNSCWRINVVRHGLVEYYFRRISPSYFVMTANSFVSPEWVSKIKIICSPLTHQCCQHCLWLWPSLCWWRYI